MITYENFEKVAIKTFWMLYFMSFIYYSHTDKFNFPDGIIIGGIGLLYFSLKGKTNDGK